MSSPQTSPQKASPAPPADESDVLLGRIMDDLELPASGAQQRRQYHRSARLQFLAPRAAVTAAIVLLIALPLWMLLRPVRIGPVQQQAVDGGRVQRVELTVRGPLLLQLSARLDGVPLAVTHLQGDTYLVEARRNGTLLLEADPMIGRLVTHTVSVTGVDDEKPHIVSDRREDDVVVIFFSDGDGSGVDWGGITATRDNGEPYSSLLVDGSAECVRLAMPTETLHITVPDRCGNELHATLTPTTDAG